VCVEKKNSELGWKQGIEKEGVLNVGISEEDRR
jgi:hypothetical protein